MTSNRFVHILAALLIGFGYLGYVHPISMASDLAVIPLEDAPPIQHKVGYYIPSGALDQVVTSPGGGGEKVRYYPYRDLEPGLYEVLSTVFIGARKVSDPKDMDALKKAGVTWVVTPEISTNSSSDSAVAWPPSEFKIKLKLTITDVEGRVVDTLDVDGLGRADMYEFGKNQSLSAVRAANDVLLEMFEALRFSKAVQSSRALPGALGSVV